MKNKYGICFSNVNSILNYSDLYLKSFENCEIYTGWGKKDEHYKDIYFSQNYIEDELCKNKQMLWAFVLEIFHYIHYPDTWTKALRGKRILLISEFEESLKNQIPIREHMYGIELFPECEFILIKPPPTQPSTDFYDELQNFYIKLDVLKNDYDIVLVSSGGYGNLICNYIYETHGKSAIYVGDVLQMYFGILSNKWLTERKDIVDMYFNKHWINELDQ